MDPSGPKVKLRGNRKPVANTETVARAAAGSAVGAATALGASGSSDAEESHAAAPAAASSERTRTRRDAKLEEERADMIKELREGENGSGVDGGVTAVVNKSGGDGFRNRLGVTTGRQPARRQ